MRPHVCFALLAVTLGLPAEAGQTNGGGGGSLNFACEGTTCICNGTYPDCKDMEDKCSGKINCPSGATYCSCTRKTSVRQRLTPKGNVTPNAPSEIRSK